MQVWQSQVAVLDGRVRVVVLDLPGHGRSDKPIRSYSMEFLAQGVNAVLEAAGVDRAVLVGHSMGVPVIREFARLHPKKIEALVAVDGAFFSPGMDSAAVERQVSMFEGPGLAKAFDQMIAPNFPNPDQAGLRRLVTQVALATPQHVVQSSIRGMMDRSIWRDAPIAVPALVVMAKETHWPADYRARVTALGADVRYEELSGVHHFLMLERPDLFNPLLIEFLKSLGLMAG
jgi:pimeloyl-ACP methyl ester carboxylesterase